MNKKLKERFNKLYKLDNSFEHRSLFSWLGHIQENLENKDKNIEEIFWDRTQVMELAHRLANMGYTNVTIKILDDYGSTALMFNKPQGDFKEMIMHDWTDVEKVDEDKTTLNYYPYSLKVDSIEDYRQDAEEDMKLDKDDRDFYKTLKKQGVFKYDYWYIFD